MMIAEPPERLMTTDDLLALPDDGVERWLVDGRLVEFGEPTGENMTLRSKDHGKAQMRFGQRLLDWSDARPEPRGVVVGGEAGFKLSDDPETTVGVDVAYVSPDVVAATPARARFYHGPPLLVVEIVSPSDTEERIQEKVEEYLAAGAKVVWVARPMRRNIIAFEPNVVERLYTADQEIDAEPHLPGFRAKVADLFG